MVVVDWRNVSAPALPYVGVAMTFDLSPVLGQHGRVASVEISLLDAAGIDDDPNSRLSGAPMMVPINYQARRGVKQILGNMLPGAQYVAWLIALTAAGERFTFVAPFAVDR